MQLSDVIRLSMETFVMGHEYGHLIAGHLEGGTRRMAVLGEADMEMNATNWRQSWRRTPLAATHCLGASKEGFDLATSLCGTYAFFSCIEVAEKSVAILHFGEEREAQSSTHPPTAMRGKAIEEMVRRSVVEESYRGVTGHSHAIKAAVDAMWAQAAPILADLHRRGWRPVKSWI